MYYGGNFLSRLLAETMGNFLSCYIGKGEKIALHLRNWTGIWWDRDEIPRKPLALLRRLPVPCASAPCLQHGNVHCL